jgi:hypothetical protein
MAQIGISEFTFGFGFLSEQTQRNWANLRIAPILPSLQQEQYEGWDAQLPLIGSDYYYQFKLSDYLERSNAKFIADGTYTGPYYRIALHRRNWNQQHQRLKIHSTKNPNTFYVAPEFHHINAFNSAFLSKQLLNRSRLIPLTDCKYIADNEQHYMTFRSGENTWKFHSDPETHESSITGERLAGLYQDGRTHFRKVDDKFATDLFLKASESAQAAIEKEKKKRKQAQEKNGDEKLIAVAPERTHRSIEDHNQGGEKDDTKGIALLDYDPTKHDVATC